MNDRAMPGPGWIEAAKAVQADTIALRRAIHAEPELGLHTPKTMAKVRAALADLPLEWKTGKSTTGAVAIKHHRNYVGCELNPDYIRLTNKRLGMVQPVLFPVKP